MSYASIFSWEKEVILNTIGARGTIVKVKLSINYFLRQYQKHFSIRNLNNVFCHGNIWEQSFIIQEIQESAIHAVKQSIHDDIVLTVIHYCSSLLTLLKTEQYILI